MRINPSLHHFYPDRSTLWLCPWILCGLFLYADAGRPCTPPPPGIYDVHPANNSDLPVNADLVIVGNGISEAELNVTVDGQPVSVLPSEDMNLMGPVKNEFEFAYPMMLDPPPAPGSNIRLEYCSPFGSPIFVDGGVSCATPEVFEFTSTAEDTVPPSAPSFVSYSIYDYVNFIPNGGLCFAPSDFAYFVSIDQGEIPDDAGSSVFFRLQLIRRDTGNPTPALVREVLLPRQSGTIKHTFRLMESDLQNEEIADSFCVKLLTVDAAHHIGNEILETCRPCYMRTDPVDSGTVLFDPPQEPTWTSDDLFPGGICSPSAATDGGVDPGTGGMCGEIGQACSEQNDCEQGVNTCMAGVCVPESTVMCGGFVGAMCTDPETSCEYCVGCDFGPCLTDAHWDCICATSAGQAAFTQCADGPSQMDAGSPDSGTVMPPNDGGSPVADGGDNGDGDAGSPVADGGDNDAGSPVADGGDNDAGSPVADGGDNDGDSVDASGCTCDSNQSGADLSLFGVVMAMLCYRKRRHVR